MLRVIYRHAVKLFTVIMCLVACYEVEVPHVVFAEVSALHEKTSVLWQANRLTRLLLLEVGSLPICIWVHWMDLGACMHSATCHYITPAK